MALTSLDGVVYLDEKYWSPSTHVPKSPPHITPVLNIASLYV